MALIRHNGLTGFLEGGDRANLPQVFLICGEPFLVRQAFDQLSSFLLRGLSREFSLVSLDGKTTPVGDVIEQATTFSFLQSAKVIAVKDAPLFSARAGAGEIAYSKKDQDLLVDLAERGIPENHILVMTSEAPDKRKKIFKTILDQGAVIDCTVALGNTKADLDEQQSVLRELARTLLSGTGKKMDGPAFNALVEQTGFNPEFLASNIEKLMAYTGTRTQITARDVTAVVHRDKKDPIFSLTNAVMDRDVSKALALLNALFQEGFHPLQILKTLENQIRKLLVVKSYLNDLYRDNPGLPPVKTMHFNGFKQVMMPRLQSWDTAWSARISEWEAAVKAEQGGQEGAKGGKSQSFDLLLAPNPKSAYPVYQNFQKSESFSLNELTRAMMLLADLDTRMKTSGIQPEVGLEHFIITLCRKKGEDRDL